MFYILCMNYKEFLKKQADEHEEFRKTPQWQVFRKWMLAAHNFTCDFCGKKYKRVQYLHVHHKYETNYTDLTPSRFMLLCQTCHEFLHKKEGTPKLGMYTKLRD